jgi:hypothetical protein
MKYGFGRHLWEVTEGQLANYLNVCAHFSNDNILLTVINLEPRCYGHNLHLGPRTYKTLLSRFVCLTHPYNPSSSSETFSSFGCQEF